MNKKICDLKDRVRASYDQVVENSKGQPEELVEFLFGNLTRIMTGYFQYPEQYTLTEERYEKLINSLHLIQENLAVKEENYTGCFGDFTKWQQSSILPRIRIIRSCLSMDDTIVSMRSPSGAVKHPLFS